MRTVRFRPEADVVTMWKRGFQGMGMFSYLPLALGALAWLVGGNIILHRAAKREGLR